MTPLRASILVALCGIIRSTDIYFRNDMITALPVIVLISWEHLINFFLTCPTLFIKRHLFKLLTIKDVFYFFMIGIGSSALGLLCFTQAFRYTSPVLCILMQKLQPIITITLGIFLLGEKVNRHFFMWAILAIISSYFVSFGFVDPFSGEWIKTAIGAAYAIAAAFFWGSGTVWGKILLSKFDQSFVVASRFFIGASFTITMAYTFHGTMEFSYIYKNGLLPEILYIAVASGIIATTLFYTGLKWLPASLASVLELFFPISSVIVGWLWLEKPLTAAQIIAALIVFFAVYKINQLPKESEKL